jgi:hypothetical protein
MGELARLPQQAVSGGITIRDIDDLSRLSGMLAKSGYFKDTTEAAQAGVKVLTGLELGFPAIASMAGIYIVQGKPSLSANLMAAAVKRSGKYNYRILEHTKEICKIAFFEQGEQVGISEFTREDAEAAHTQNMAKFAKNMLFARAMSNGVKWFCPDIFLGPVYTPEELGVQVNGEGEVIDLPRPQIEPDLPELHFDSAVAQHVSKEDARAFWNLAKSAGYTREGVKALTDSMGIAGSDQIPHSLYKQLCEAGRDPELAAAWNAKAIAAEPPLAGREAPITVDGKSID